MAGWYPSTIVLTSAKAASYCNHMNSLSQCCQTSRPDCKILRMWSLIGQTERKNAKTEDLGRIDSFYSEKR